MLLACTTVLGQNSKVQQMYDAGLHKDVVNYYATLGDNTVSKAEVALFAKSMMRIGRIQEAVDLMEYVFRSHPESPVTISTLSEALIYNGEYSKAFYLLSEYSKEAATIPDYKIHLEKAALLSEWESRLSRIKVNPYSLINSEKNEFSIYKNDNQIMFCSSDIAELNDDMSRLKLDYTALFKLEDEQKKHVPFNKGAFKGRFNVGPFHMGTEKMYFTFSEEVAPGVNELVIRETSISNPSVSKSEPINLCSTEYSIAHPTLTDDGQKMIFASNMPGGEGGMDLYYSLWTGKKWSDPISLGPTVNTPGNEVFPRLRADTIFFASDGHLGYGGFDIYRVTHDLYHEDVRNMYAPINSPFDDFDLFIIDKEAGYFTSNRPGGKGGDDIFYYDLIVVKEAPELISGIIEINAMPQRNVRMLLTDAEGNILEQAFTDDNGVFYFSRKPDGGTFNIKVAEEEIKSDNVDLFLTDTEGEKTQKLVADANGNFTFELLAVDDFFIDYMKLEDNSLFSLTLRGQIYKEHPGDCNDLVGLVSMDEYGIVNGEATTMEHGYFELENMQPSNDYYFNILSKDPSLKIAIVDNSDQIVQVLQRGENGRFYYKTEEEQLDMISIFNEDNVLISVQKDEAITLPNILYDVNSAELKQGSKNELSRLVDIMKNNAKLTIELSSHTDSQGNDDYNEQLSQQRARSAFEYIVSFGIDPERITAVGYGEKKLLNLCTDGVRCNGAEHAINRRTEFRIISNN